ncbi:MAG TPA: hypothetical protein VH592_26445 [Gemmataceae bacterium]|jgi:hypothetical protein
MLSVARLSKAGYVLGLAIALFCLLRPNMSHGQFPGGIAGNNPNLLQLQLQSAFGAIPVNGLGGGGMMGMGGGVGGMNANLLQVQLMLGLGAVPLNGMMGMGGNMMGLAGGMMGVGSMNIGGGSLTGVGGGVGGYNPNLLQLQLLSEFGAVPVIGVFPINGSGGANTIRLGGGNGMMMGMGGGGMGGFAGKNMGGFNGGSGL